MTATTDFGQEIIACIPQIKAYAIALTRSGHFAEDLVQDTLERAWVHQDRYKRDHGLKTWLCSILRNRFIDLQRQQKFVVEDVDGRHASYMVAAEDQHWHLQYVELLNAIDSLPASVREALALVWLVGLSHEEAAAVLEAPLGSVKSRINRARIKLGELANDVALQADE